MDIDTMKSQPMRSSCSAKLREASELIDRMFVCSSHSKVAPLPLSNTSKATRTSSSSSPRHIFNFITQQQQQQKSPTMKKKEAYLEQINNLLEQKTSQDGMNYLKSTVVDLLHEVEVLKLNLEESKQETTALQQEITDEKQQDRDRIDALIATLQKATLNHSASRSKTSSHDTGNSNNNNSAASDSSSSSSCSPSSLSVTMLSQEQAQTLNGEQASLMTITSLTRKVEELNVVNSELVMEKQEMVMQLEDLHCEAEAKQVKIKALEAQFKSINRTRQKVVQQLSTSTTTSHMNNEKENQPVERPRYGKSA